MTTAINTVWVVFAAALVFFMEGGFALLEAGLVQMKNTLSIVMKVMADVTLGSLVFGALGFGLMFGAHSFFGLFGTSGFFLQGAIAHVADIPTLVLWFFEMAFAVAAISIVSGAVSERMRFGAYLFYVILGILAYSISGHWVWAPSGWLGRMGMEDFAGSAVVHTFGGFSALAAAAVLGPRMGRFTGKLFPASNLPLAFVGTFILWFGWFGFNAGSTLNAFSPLIGTIVVNTMIAAAASGLVAILLTRMQTATYDPSMAINGVLSGLVAITAGCAFVPVWAAFVIGSLAGILIVVGTPLLDRFKIDDPVGAFPVHGLNGAFGTIAVGVFAIKGGLLFGGGLHLLGVQALGTLVIAIWGFGITAMGLSILKKLNLLRVSELEEQEGLDLRLHGRHAYHRDVINLPRTTHDPEARTR